MPAPSFEDGDWTWEEQDDLDRAFLEWEAEQIGLDPDDEDLTEEDIEARLHEISTAESRVHDLEAELDEGVSSLAAATAATDMQLNEGEADQAEMERAQWFAYVSEKRDELMQARRELEELRL